MKRPLRSVYLGNLKYLSVYGMGVAQAMGMLKHWHRSVSIWDDPDSVEKQIAEMQPDVIWTHMALWPPNGAMTAEQICHTLARWKRRGAAVFLHDGDPKPDRELPTGIDIGSVFSIALVNRTVGERHLGLPAQRWPYAAMVQEQIADPRTEWQCDLLFAGIMKTDGIYAERTKLVNELHQHLGRKMLIVAPSAGDVNNRMLSADVAASAGSVLGYARPEVKGWIDTRVFQYGSGGVLIHDDAGEFLEPDVHYLKFDRKNAVESVLACVEKSKTVGAEMRVRAFQHIQQHHTWLHRVEIALAGFFGR